MVIYKTSAPIGAWNCNFLPFSDYDKRHEGSQGRNTSLGRNYFQFSTNLKLKYANFFSSAVFLFHSLEGRIPGISIFEDRVSDNLCLNRIYNLLFESARITGYVVNFTWCVCGIGVGWEWIQLSGSNQDPNGLQDQDKVLRWEFIKENEKVRKQELDQESDQENKKTRTRPRKRPRKKRKTFFFS